ncbi:MAG: NAD(P)H-dependent oxidoreductase [Mogibacterium sp.]|nr:NAD(P)H-dependent oxidoreductase [Mogibacterium sp.]
MRGSEIHISGSAISGEGTGSRTERKTTDCRDLTVIKPACDSDDRSARLDSLLMPALETLQEQGVRVRIFEHVSEFETEDLTYSRILFAVALSEAGVNIEYYRLLEYLRGHADCLTGSVGGIIVDGGGEFYTKAIARRFAFSANMCGCIFPGKSLVEATGSLGNFHVLSKVSGKEPLVIYREQLGSLIDRILAFDMPVSKKSTRLLVVHASTRKTSNTLLLWDMIKRHLFSRMEIREISLQNGQIYDCRGCSYEACLHFGEQDSCFYGGIITEQVYPALLEADALLLICPNYNDALSANLTAFVNRLTSLFRYHDFSGKRIYALIVSGYSGGDIIAEQLIGALCFNKSFILPAGFAMLETANDPRSILSVDNIEMKAREFAGNIF